MFCTKCGMQNNNGEKFCRNCGVLLENNQITQQMNNQSQEQVNFNKGLDSKYINQAVNPNMKKWAILSIIVPIVAIIWYVFIGLSFYIAVFIAVAGFSFAQKGEVADKKLSIIGRVANGILVGIAIVMLVLQLILSYMSV